MKMKRRYLVFLFTIFFMFLYIGPMNLLPYDVPLAIVQQPQDVQRVDPPSIVATDYNVVLAADSDDDYWKYDSTGPSWQHITSQGTMSVSLDWSTEWYTANQRFSLDIPQGATIHSANITNYETQDPASRTFNMYRIDETNVGPLEDDSSLPDIDYTDSHDYDFDGVASEWNTENITDLIQIQVDLVDWESGFYFGVNYNCSIEGAQISKFEDYSHGDSHHSYLNISYTAEEEEEEPYGANWLMGWGRRQQHNITQTAGTGENYTVPLYVWNGGGTSLRDDGYVSGYAQDDFDDIRFTGNNGSAELEYQLNTTYNSELTDYMSNDSYSLGSYPANYPNAFYYNQRTYVGRQGYKHDPYITYYDHENETWAGWYWVGNNSVLWDLNDHHGAPAIFVDNEGYIHVFWGGHAYHNDVQHSKSDVPNDITSFSLVSTFSDWGELTYPHLYYDATNDVLHCYGRSSDGVGNAREIEYRNSTDKGVTWSDAWDVWISDTMSPYFTAGEMDSTNTTLSIGFVKFLIAAPNNYENVYYIQVNFTSKTVYNVTGHSQGTEVSETAGEDANCLVFDASEASLWGADVHLDDSGTPYLMWTCDQYTGGAETSYIMFTYWNGSGWNPIDNVTVAWSWVAGMDFIVHSSTNITAFLSESTQTSRNMTKYTWDGDTWTRDSVVIENGVRYIAYTMVPIHHDDELQVTMSEHIGYNDDIQMWAYGTGGIVQYTWSKHALFYVRVPDDLSSGNATIYLYYSNSGVSTTENATMEIDTGNDPVHDGWGTEEEESNNAPTNDQTPACVNLDDTDNLYAKYREYQITANVSDGNGFSDLEYLEISLYSNDRGSLYWTIRFTEDTGVFSEQSDTSNMISLNTTGSTNSSSGNALNVTFHITVHWNHTDLTDTDIKQYVTDDHPSTDTDWTEVNYDVETRLDFEIGPAVDDALGTPDRGDIDGTALAFGTIQYFNSASNIRPLEEQIDVWISCTEYGSEIGPWEATNYDEPTGYFSYIVTVDNEVGLDTYTFIAVEEDSGSDGTDLMHTTHIDTYISDRLIVDIQADDETPDNEQQVTFTLTITYEYDSTTCTTYNLTVYRNSTAWYAFTNGNKSLFNDTNSDALYNYTGYSISETTHGLTALTSNTKTVTWSAIVTTTTITATTSPNIFYELFLSLNMWGYLGPLGLVVVGYVLAKKDKGLGVIAFMVQCLFVAQYLVLVSVTPEYWWHVIIILLGGIFSCVVPLMDKR